MSPILEAQVVTKSFASRNSQHRQRTKGSPGRVAGRSKSVSVFAMPDSIETSISRIIRRAGWSSSTRRMECVTRGPRLTL